MLEADQHIKYVICIRVSNSNSDNSMMTVCCLLFGNQIHSTNKYNGTIDSWCSVFGVFHLENYTFIKLTESFEMATGQREHLPLLILYQQTR